jgi:hypothetical protein
MQRHILTHASWRIGRSWPLGLPVEDPIRLREFSQKMAELNWGNNHVRVSITAIFEEVSRLVQAELQYYYQKRQAASRRAKIFRFAAWTSGSLGILTPIVYPLWINPPENFLSWGYLAVALSGIFVVADKVFSGSEAHARFVSTQLKLEYSYSKFVMEFQILLLAYDNGPTPINAINIIAKVLNFIDIFHDSLGAETTEWKEALASAKEELGLQAELAAGNRKQN